MSNALKVFSSKKILDLCKDVTFDNAIVSITDLDGTILHANDRFCQISGYSRDELVGSKHRIIKSDYHPKEFFTEMWKTLMSGKVWKGEICNRGKDGSPYWVETTIIPISDEEEKDIKFVSVRLDVTHRKKFEEVLTSMQTVASIGYWEWEIDKDMLFWSDEIYTIHGLTKETYTPDVESAVNLYAPEHRPIIKDCIERTFETGESYDVELQILKGEEKTPIWVRAVGSCETLGGRIFRMKGTFQDIDKEKKNRINYQKTQAQLYLALESAGIGNWVYYPQEDKLIWDDASFDIFGVERESFNAKFQDWVECLIPGDQVKSSEEFLKTLERKEDLYESSFRIRHPKRGVRTIKGRALIEYNSKGQPTEIVGLNWDITAEIEFQETLIKAREKALDATHAKSAFLASMSHEIRTPMNGMMGMLELLSETKLSDKQNELIETVQSCGDQLLNIVNDILDFSKIEAGKMNLEYRRFEPKSVVKGVKAIFEGQASKKGIRIETNVDSYVPKILLGDETRLKQILTNLVSNSLKFTESGSITIEIISDRKRSSKHQGVFIFNVKDTGIGIPLDKQEHLFESFRQVDESTTRKFGGTGLGLAICRSLVEKMGGQIGVESSPGSGSMFYFEVMAGIGTDSSQDTVDVDNSSKTFKKDLKVLLVEDNETNQRLAISFLKKLGVIEIIDVAGDGQQAVNRCFESRDGEGYDLILMDVQMPVMDGITATQEIKKLLGVNCPKIIAMTANAFAEDKQMCFDAGMDNFLAKPVKKKSLENILIEYFPVDIEDEKIGEKDETMTTSRGFGLIDTAKISFEFEDDMDIFEELIEDYEGQYGDFISQLENCISSKNADQLKITGHTLKGIVSNFYSDELKEAAHKLELSGRNSDFSQVEMQIDVFKTINKKVMHELKEFLEEFNSKSQEAA